MGTPMRMPDDSFVMIGEDGSIRPLDAAPDVFTEGGEWRWDLADVKLRVRVSADALVRETLAALLSHRSEGRPKCRKVGGFGCEAKVRLRDTYHAARDLRARVLA